MFLPLLLLVAATGFIVVAVVGFSCSCLVIEAIVDDVEIGFLLLPTSPSNDVSIIVDDGRFAGGTIFATEFLIL